MNHIFSIQFEILLRATSMEANKNMIIFVEISNEESCLAQALSVLMSRAASRPTANLQISVCAVEGQLHQLGATQNTATKIR